MKPIPVNYMTFDKLMKETMEVRKIKSQKKTLGFGVGERIPLSEY